MDGISLEVTVCCLTKDCSDASPSERHTGMVMVVAITKSLTTHNDIARPNLLGKFRVDRGHTVTPEFRRNLFIGLRVVFM
jgi:hypothetical protein